MGIEYRDGYLVETDEPIIARPRYGTYVPTKKGEAMGAKGIFKSEDAKYENPKEYMRQRMLRGGATGTQASAFMPKEVRDAIPRQDSDPEARRLVQDWMKSRTEGIDQSRKNIDTMRAVEERKGPPPIREDMKGPKYDPRVRTFSSPKSLWDAIDASRQYERTDDWKQEGGPSVTEMDTWKRQQERKGPPPIREEMRKRASTPESVNQGMKEHIAKTEEALGKKGPPPIKESMKRYAPPQQAPQAPAPAKPALESPANAGAQDVPMLPGETMSQYSRRLMKMFGRPAVGATAGMMETMGGVAPQASQPHRRWGQHAEKGDY